MAEQEQRLTALPAGYGEFLAAIKQQINQAQLRAMLSVNRELVLLYWRIGSEILRRQQELGWGSKIVERLGADLRRAFPDMRGLSRSNLHYMRAFAEAYPEEVIVQQLVGQLPWGHNVYLLDAVKDPATREWYARQTIANGWSRAVLMHQVESALHTRQGRSVSNFAQVLPSTDSELTQEVLKDPYNFGFLSVSGKLREREIQRDLIAHIREFLLELGRGFAYVGSEYRLEVNQREYFLDLLFYHLQLNCFVVIELKPGEFEPEYAGKMNFYLSAVDAQLKRAHDNPSIGIILCKSRDQLTVEYALRDLNKPIGVSEYVLNLLPQLPEPLQHSLPSAQELEAELGSDENEPPT